MKVYADLHIHSPFSIATSKRMTPVELENMSRKKGINIIATGDIFHYEWQNIIYKRMIDQKNGFYRIKGGKIDFILSGEVSLVFGEKGKKKKVHILILCKEFKEVKILTKIFSDYGILSSNGRPFLKMSLKKLCDYVQKETENTYLIPAHIWTPHYSLFGSKSGFDSFDDAFGENTERIIAMETGLSSDPPMNWKVKDAMKFNLVSNSDSHSPIKIGREANVFESISSYDDLINSIKTGNKFLYTIEFFPEEGKYHYDGHRKCNICLHPEESKKLNNKCPVCGKKLTIGVLHRVYKLSDIHGNFNGSKIDFKYSIPLIEIIAEILGKKDNSVVVRREYEKLIKKLGQELKIIEEIDYSYIRKHAGYKLSESIKNLRENNVERIPGYDGKYGKIILNTR